jgi:hypothetical protein
LTPHLGFKDQADRQAQAVHESLPPSRLDVIYTWLLSAQKKAFTFQNIGINQFWIFFNYFIAQLNHLHIALIPKPVELVETRPAQDPHPY